MENNKTETLLTNHIKRLENDIAERLDTMKSLGLSNGLEAEQNKVDARNIASLREGRIPQYSDHMDCLVGDQSIDMSEFADLTQEIRGYNPWPSDPAVA